MTKCSYCGKDELLPFHCSFCHRDFCLNHRLPENHECGQSPTRTPLGPWYAKKTSESKVEVPKLKSQKPKKNASEGQFHFVKSQEELGGKKPFPIKKVISLSLVAIIIGIFLWYSPIIISTVQNRVSQSSYTKVTVVMGQVAIYDHGDNHYGFSYRLLSSDPIDKFYVSTGLLGQFRIFSATVGATYRDLGIEIKVSEVYPDYIVLLVKALY